MIPEGAEALEQEGYYVQVSEEAERWTGKVVGYRFFLHREGTDGSLHVCYVNEPLTQKHRAQDSPPDSSMITPRLFSRSVGENTARAIAEVLVRAADHAMGANERCHLELAKQEQVRQELIQENALLRQRDDEQYAKLYNQVIWLIGNKFRLRRRGKRATVFGEIISVWPSPTDEVPVPPRAVMHTVSEKGVDMQIELRDVIFMEVKEEDSDRRYTEIYKEEVKTDAGAQPA
jgi:hypothetical protein